MSEPIAADGEPFPAEAPSSTPGSGFRTRPPATSCTTRAGGSRCGTARWCADADDEATLRANPRVRASDLVYPIGEPPSGFYLINV